MPELGGGRAPGTARAGELLARATLLYGRALPPGLGKKRAVREGRQGKAGRVGQPCGESALQDLM